MNNSVPKAKTELKFRWEIREQKLRYLFKLTQLNKYFHNDKYEDLTSKLKVTENGDTHAPVLPRNTVEFVNT